MAENFRYVGLEGLVSSKTNPRKTFDEASLNELAASIERQGIIEPLIVRKVNGSGKLEIVAGERRYRAAKLAHQDTVPIIEREISDAEALEIQIVENDQREDIHPLDQCDGYLVLAKNGLSIEEIAKRVGKTPSHVAKRMQFSNLIKPARKAFADGDIQIGHAIELARLTPEQQKGSMEIAHFTVAEFRERIQRNYFLVLGDAPFDTADPKLFEKAGPCTTCPKRSGYNRFLFDDIKKEDVCTDPDCYDQKVRNFIKRWAGTHDGAPMLSIVSLWHAKERAKHIWEWTPAGKQNCPDTKEGIVVEVIDVHERKELKLGSVLKVCLNPNCATHHPKAERQAARSGYRRDPAEIEKERKRRTELKRRGLVFKEVARAKILVTDEDYRAMLDTRIKALSADDARAVCKAMGWEVKKDPMMGAKFQESVKNALKDQDAAGVKKWLFLLSLAENELWFYNNMTSVPKPAVMEAKAKAAEVDLAALAKRAAEKDSKPKPPKADVKPKPKGKKKK